MRRWQPDPTASNRWHGVLVALVIGYLLSFSQRQIPTFVAIPLASRFSLGDAEIGALHGTSFGLVYGILALLGGWLADRFDRPRLIALSLLVAGLATLLSAFASSIVHLWLLRGLTAAAQAVLVPAAFSLIGTRVPARLQGLGVGLFATGPFLGAALGFVLTSQAAFQTWDAPYLLFGPAAMVLALVFLIFGKDADRALRVPTRSSPARRPPAAVMVVIAAMALSAVAGHTILGWTAIWLVRSVGLSGTEAATAFALALGLCGSAGVITGGLLGDQAVAAGRPRLIVQVGSASACAALALLVYPLADRSMAPVLLCVLIFAFALAHGIGSATLQDIVAPAQRGRVHGAAIFVLNCFSLGLGPWMVGLASDSNPSPAWLGTVLAGAVSGAMAVSACLSLVATLLIHQINLAGKHALPPELRPGAG